MVKEHGFEVDTYCVLMPGPQPEKQHTAGRSPAPHGQFHGFIAIDDAQLLRGSSASMHLRYFECSAVGMKSPKKRGSISQNTLASGK